MILFDLLNKSQKELGELLEGRISSRSSAVWIAEEVEGLGLLPRADFVVVFLEGTTMMIAERYPVTTNILENKKVKAILKKSIGTVEDGMGVTFTVEKDYYELAAFRKGWYDWLSS